MGKVAQITVGAVIIGTLFGVLFFELTRIPITGGLVSLFALVGVLVSWLAISVRDLISRRTGRDQSAKGGAPPPPYPPARGH